jgi:hypothetical protein
MGKDAVHQGDIGRQLDQFGALRVVGLLGRGDQQTQNESSHCSDQFHSELHDILGVGTQMVLGQDGMKQDAKSAPPKTNANTIKPIVTEITISPKACAGSQRIASRFIPPGKIDFQPGHPLCPKTNGNFLTHARQMQSKDPGVASAA